MHLEALNFFFRFCKIQILRALLAVSLRGFPSLHFRENFKKVKKSTPQQLPFLFPFPGK
jgi:hypothetical protein